MRTFFVIIMSTLFVNPVIAENVEPQYSVDVIVNWFPLDSEANLIATYTFNSYSLDTLQLLNAENWAFTKELMHPLGYDRCIKRIDKANNIWKRAKLDKLEWWQYYCHWNWKTFHDWWLCWISDYYHPEIVNDPRFLTNRKRQVDKCAELINWWTTFYWRWHRKERAVNKFKFLYH